MNKEEYIGLKKGVLTVVGIVEPTVNKKNTVVKCLCSRCGQYSNVRVDRFSIKASFAAHFCENCKEDYYLQKAKEKYVGVKNGVLECIDVIKSPVKRAKWGSRTVAICRCSVCGSITEVRPERLINKGKYIPQSCSNCVEDLMRQRTTERYQKEYHCEGEEYKKKIHDASRLQSIRSNAKGRNLNFNLTEEQAISILHQDCYYCGQPHADGIDRLDSNIGYTEENCVPCCGVCNIMKNKFTTDTFFNHIELIYKKHLINNLKLNKTFMEKRIPFVQFQSVKSVAKAIDPYMRQKARLEAQIDGLDDEFKVKAEEELKKLKERLKAQLAAKKEKLEVEIKGTDDQIAAIEAGIVSIIGFHVTDLLKKVIEPNDKGIKETKYLPTDIVSYDTTTKEFVVTVPDEETPTKEPECPTPETEEPVEEENSEEVVEEPVEEEDEEVSEREAAEAEAEDNPNQLPW